MNLEHHLNLINNHGYDGYIAVYKGANTASTNNGDIVLVKNEKVPGYDGTMDSREIAWLTNHRTIEKPLTQCEIDSELSSGSLVKTRCTCVGVPVKLLEAIEQ